MKKIPAAALLLALAGCADNAAKAPANQITFNDFEAVEGWSAGEPVPSLTKERAHSGTYALRVGNGVDFRLGYRNVLGKISTARLHKLTIQAWVFVPGPQAECVLVTQVLGNEQNKNVFWDGLKIKEATKTVGKWVLIEKEITLPPTATPETQLLVYLWRSNSPQPTYLDDLRISRVE